MGWMDEERTYVVIACRKYGGAERFSCYVIAGDMHRAREKFLNCPFARGWEIRYCGPVRVKQIKSWMTIR